ncbi:MAG TPA: alpha-E domain-containing protein, partial [Janthinobacterium sp.]|nr:alpha-E domain-containing protein [Janthinobacterium sp.]
TSEDLVREDSNLSSRVAENLLWYGRHAERCDNIGRLLRVALTILFEVRSGYPGAEWPTVEALCAWFHLTDIADHAPAANQSQSQGQQTQTQRQVQSAAVPPGVAREARIEAALLLAVVSPDVPGLARQQQQLYNTASHLRERLSVDNWRALNRMVGRVGKAEQAPSQSQAMTILDGAAASLMTLAGFGLDGMTRDLGWRFLSTGRRLERLQFQSMVLRHALGMEPDGGLDWVLELSDSIVTYRSRYRSQPEWLPVLDLLILDESNPRSIAYQVNGILKNLKKIARTYGSIGLTDLAPLRDELKALSPEEDFFGGNPMLIGLLARIQSASVALSEHIGLQFFSYTGHVQAGKEAA